MNISAILSGSKIKQATTSRIQDQFNAIQKEYIWELPLPVEFLSKREKPLSVCILSADFKTAAAAAAEQRTDDETKRKNPQR